VVEEKRSKVLERLSRSYTSLCSSVGSGMASVDGPKLLNIYEARNGAFFSLA